MGACFEVALALVVMPTLGWQWLLALSTGPLLAFALVCPVSNCILVALNLSIVFLSGYLNQLGFMLQVVKLTKL